MSFLPFQPATESATKADIQGLWERLDDLENRLCGRVDEADNRVNGRIDELDNRLSGRIHQLTGPVDHLSDRMDRLQTTLLGGFAAMIAALLAAGFLA